MKIKHVFDHNGNHALVVDGKRGEFVPYEDVAANGLYLGFSPYYGKTGFVLKAEKVEAEEVLIVTDFDENAEDWQAQGWQALWEKECQEFKEKTPRAEGPTILDN